MCAFRFFRTQEQRERKRKREPDNHLNGFIVVDTETLTEKLGRQKKKNKNEKKKKK
jgi:hypothetical protein